jgi:hypothetical protein
MGVARLSGLSDDGADPFVNLCHTSLQLEQRLGTDVELGGALLFDQSLS